MAVLEIVDDCLAPERHIFLTYTGPNPWGVAEKITNLIEPFFHVSASGTGNDIINWDVVGDQISFYSHWWVKKKFSAHSTMKVDLRIIGKQHKTTGEGYFRLRITADLVTQFSTFGFLLKPLWYLYSYFFYNRVRRRFIERCREMLHRFRDELKEHYDLKYTEIPAGAVVG